MVLVSVKLKVRRGEKDDILTAFRRFIEPTLVQPGCLGYRCLQDVQDQNLLVIEEQWNSKAEVAKHVRSAEYRRFLTLLESATEAPTVEFHDVARTSGLEAIEDMRANTCSRRDGFCRPTTANETQRPVH